VAAGSLPLAEAEQRSGIGQPLGDPGVRLLANGAGSPFDGRKAPVDQVGRGFRVSKRGRSYGSGGLVLNTPDGVTAPAP